MRAVIHSVTLVLGLLGAACATDVKVGFDPDEDFSTYQSWTWLPGSTASVDAPDRGTADVESRLRQLIAGALSARGFERDDAQPDFFVTYTLALHRRSVSVYVPHAPYLLSSNSSAPSYWIEGSDPERRSFEALQIAIGLADRRGRVTWYARLERRLEGGGEIPLDDAVSELLARIPQRQHAPPRAPTAPAREPRTRARALDECEWALVACDVRARERATSPREAGRAGRAGRMGREGVDA